MNTAVEIHQNSRFDESQIFAIRRDMETGEKLSALAQKYHCSIDTLSRIKRGETYSQTQEPEPEIGFFTTMDAERMRGLLIDGVPGLEIVGPVFS